MRAKGRGQRAKGEGKGEEKGEEKGWKMWGCGEL
jgi:hypothetical protein